MSKPLKRTHRSRRPPAPSWDFMTRRLAGIRPDSPAEAAEKERLKAEWMARKQRQGEAA